MGSLSKFLGKPRIVEVENKYIDDDGKESIEKVSIEVHPLKVKNLALFSEEPKTKEDQARLAKDILKLSIPDSTEEEIDNLNMDAFMKLMDVINEINGFKDERIGKIKEAIAQARAK